MRILNSKSFPFYNIMLWAIPKYIAKSPHMMYQLHEIFKHLSQISHASVSFPSFHIDNWHPLWFKPGGRLIFLPSFYVPRFMPTAILAEAYCFTRVPKNLSSAKICFLRFLCLKILHRTQIRWPQKLCFSLSLYYIFIYLS